MAKTTKVCIVLDDDLAVKLRKIQAKTIIETGKSYSFSKALNDQLRWQLK